MVGSVKSAGSRTAHINTGRQNSVAERAQIGTDIIPVYDLTLDEDNVYYANGILVENCADALALTFSEPVKLNVENRPRMAEMDYDTFGYEHRGRQSVAEM